MKRFRYFTTLMFIAGLIPAMVKAQQPPFDAAKLKAYWEMVQNHYDGKNQFLSTFTFVNNGSQPLPAKGWQLYFNSVRFAHAGPLPGNIKVEHINGDLYRFVPGENFKGLASGDSLKLNVVADAWAINYTDAPGGFYLVWDHQPEKGYPVKDYTIRPSTRPEQLLRYPGDKIATVTARDVYDQNAGLRDIPADQLPQIFPTPASYKAVGSPLVMRAVPNITADQGLSASARYLEKVMSGFLPKGNAATNANALLKLREGMPAESYELTVNSNGIIITAGGEAGAFYAIQSLRSLAPPSAFSGVQSRLQLPGVEVKDAPRFGFRGLFVDVARNFHDKEDMFRMLDIMALYKLNTLHFHFSDDEGWRLEIPSLPELTTVGAKRGHTVNGRDMLPPSYGSGPDTSNVAGTGYFSRNDFIEILRYATERHIRVLPEIEAPGHARASVKAMEARYHRLMEKGDKAGAEEFLMTDFADKSKYYSVQYWTDNVMNIAMPGTYRFIDKVVGELQAMYKEAGAELTMVHLGGDELPAGAYEKSPACLALIDKDSTVNNNDDLWYYFYRNVNGLLQQRGLELAGWEEAGMRRTNVAGLRHSIPNPDFASNNFQLNVWNNLIGGGAEDLAYRLANAGYKVILSGVSNFYFDMAYMKSFDEPGFYWGGFVDVDKPFYFIPYDYYKNTKFDGRGEPVSPAMFKGKEHLSDFGTSNIKGIQGLLWSETLISKERMEYQMFPKVLGLAERAWAKDPDWAREKDTARADKLYARAWNVFTNVAGKRELPRLDRLNGGYAYRVPSAGVKVENGKVHANVQFPGMKIYYTTNGEEPTAKSKVYTTPLPATGTIKFKVIDSRGRGGKTVSIKGDAVQVKMN